MKEDIIKEAYNVFQQYSVTHPLSDVCTYCCLKEPFHSELVKTKKHKISYEALYEYNTAAYAVEQAENETKYFLPRQIELVFESKIPKINEELMFDRCLNIDFLENEKVLLDKFAMFYFQSYLENYIITGIKNIFIEELILMLNNITDIQLIFSAWESNISISSTKAFGDLLGDSFQSYKNILKGKFNTSASKEFKVVISDWLTSDTTKSLFVSRLEKITEGQYNEELESCYIALCILKEEI
jgi:hypothetical protein